MAESRAVVVGASVAGLLMRGTRSIEQLLPGMLQELAADGARSSIWGNSSCCPFTAGW
ncbi:hypothetical protein [Streptomyces sp. NPDC029721]|uniref:hypothetical protein n=1 Tax=Streptomyces sp. NPDC029721 TaxID=3157090 RepID=UPI0033CC1155